MSKGMKKIIFVAIGVAAVSLVIMIGVLYMHKYQNSNYDEGKSALVDSDSWTSAYDQSNHIVETYTLGKTATEVAKSLNGIELNHKYIDDVCIYEMYPSNADLSSIIFFIHGQGSRKEEYLYDMVMYAEEGYICVTLDIEGSGERVSNQTIMALQAVVDTGEDINTLVEYYQTITFANTDSIAILGLSQGGSIAYWYAAYGRYPLSALVVGSTTPDYKYYIDKSSITNGVIGDTIWTESEIESFISVNNPINRIEVFCDLPILSGHGADDNLVPTTGDEELEKYLNDMGSGEASFYYLDGVGHEVTDGFMQKVLPFFNKYL